MGATRPAPGAEGTVAATVTALLDAAAGTAQLQACEAHAGDCVYLSPPAILEPGVRTGAYRRGTTTILAAADGSSRISAEDLAVAIVDELENPGRDRHFTAGY
ncbi:hypothetical protein [Amycolatopsis speibonae]|uniref:Uncharacterized protein n=1 Tax=Amycolatopsis speibonae TaxID=1450224 RepID=A0ABV7P7D9_9PSEU